MSLLIFAGTSIYAIKATSTTEFCVSCHERDIPFEEYQSSHHFINREGIRAGCADCHIPQSPTRMLWAKIMAGKDLYHHFITGKIDTGEKFEEHRQELAEMVWHKMESQASETCRSCHSFEAMDFYAQSEGAAKMHQMAKRVEEGLQFLLSSGALQDFLTNHPVTSAAFPLEKYQNSIKFDLHNPDLSPETEQLDAKFWLALD